MNFFNRVKKSSGNLYRGLKEKGIRTYLKDTWKGLYRVDPDTMYFKDILFINGCSLGHPSRYRVDHQIEQLSFYNFSCQKVWYEDLKLENVKFYQAIIIFRCPITPTVEKFVNKAKQFNKPVFYDIDDLVIDKKYVETIDYLKTISKEERSLYYDGVKRMGETLKICDYALTTTNSLKNELLNYTKEVFINRNVASEDMRIISERALLKAKKNENIVIGYASGSITHNPDYKMILPVLLKLLKKFPKLRLKIIGLLDMPKELIPFKERVILVDFMDWKELPEELATIDINIAPMEKSLFNEAKSENKWIEASLVKVVTVASNLGAFKNIIKDRDTGFLCNSQNEWEKTLSKLIKDENLRKKVGNNAYEQVTKYHITLKTGKNLANILKEKLNNTLGFVLPSCNISGGTNVVFKHATVLQKNGFNISLLSMDSDQENIIINKHELPVISLNKTGMSYYPNFKTLVSTLWTTKFFVDTYPNVIEKKYLVQNYETDFYNLNKQQTRFLANSTYYSNDKTKYLTISKWCQKWLKENFDKDSEYIPNGIDRNIFPYKKRSFKGTIIILIEGNSEDDYKNVDESFRIVENLDRKFFKIHYLSYKGEPKEWYRFDKFFHKVPYNNVGEIYQNADILIKSSKLESFSYPPLEMMSTGGITIVAKNEGNVEYLKNNYNTMFYEIGDINDAVAKINLIINEKSLREKIIRNSKKTVSSRSWENIETNIIKLYK